MSRMNTVVPFWFQVSDLADPVNEGYYVTTWDFYTAELAQTTTIWIDPAEPTLAAFDWDCPECRRALVETLDKIDLAPCDTTAPTESQPDSSSTGNLNAMSDSGNESIACGHGKEYSVQLPIGGSQSPSKSHWESTAGGEILEDRNSRSQRTFSSSWDQCRVLTDGQSQRHKFRND